MKTDATPDRSVARGPLAGVRVVDLTTVIMGPFATQILAELGADVLKIEHGEGDTLRMAGVSRSSGMGALFLQANKGKRSAVLDLKDDDDRRQLLELIGTADIFISNVRPGALKRLGLDQETLTGEYEQLIHVSCCGFDPDGPYAGRPTYDDLIQGGAGLSWLMKSEEGAAYRYAPLAIADRIAGLHAAYAVTTALYARSVNGRGQAVIVPMFEVMTHFVLGDHLGGMTFEPPAGPAEYRRLTSPERRPYQTRDGWLCVLIYTDQQWVAFCRAVAAGPSLSDDPRFRTYAARSSHIDAFYATIRQHMSMRSTSEWQSVLTACDIPNMPVKSPKDLLTDPQLTAVEFLRVDEHPTEGIVRTMRNPTKWYGTPLNHDQAPAPRVGEHTANWLE